MNDEVKKSMIEKNLAGTIKIIEEIKNVENEIILVSNMIVKSIKDGNKVVLFGNGGSAADAQHIAAEFIGRFNMERQGIPAIALTTDTSVLTSLGNDYSFDKIFSRQCESIVSEGDVVIGISTSGNSKNVENGLITSKKNGATTLGLLGNSGGTIKKNVDFSIIVNSSSTPKIQEVHRVLYHIICDIVEKELSTQPET